MELYGAIQLFLYACAGVTVARFLRGHGVADDRPRLLRSQGVSIGIAIAVVISCWWYHGYYHRHLSPDAEAVKSITELVRLWEAGERSEALELLDELTIEQPWVYEPDPYRDRYP